MEIVKTSNMEIKTEETTKSTVQQLVIETVPCGISFEPLHRTAWNLIQPHAEALANKTNGEYTGYTLKQALWNGNASLHLAYMDDSGKASPENNAALVLKHLATPEKDFVGYIITRLDPQSMHIWQVVIMPEYQNTNAFNLGFEYLKTFLKMWGLPDVTLSSQREGWHHKCIELGFVELYTVYRQKFKS